MSDFAQIAAKAKGEVATASAETADEAAGGDAVGATGAAPEEESTAQFEPVVQLEEIEVKTHEEDEEILWKMRAKLFIFGETLLNKGTGQKEWVERGIGEVKFLQHKEHKFIRVLMRQEKTMKVISNHVADPRIVLKPNAGSDRVWVWNAFDFTDGQLEEVTFALRFGKSDAANEFKEQFASAQKVMASIQSGEQPAKEEGGGETPAAEEADPSTDAAADALQSLSVGGKEDRPAEEAAPAES